MDTEFIIDEEPQKVKGSLEDGLVGLLRQSWQLRQSVQQTKLENQEQGRRQGDFLKQLLALKERRCDQFVALERARVEENVADSELRTETEKWVHRLEVFQQSFDAALAKFGVTRYDPRAGRFRNAMTSRTPNLALAWSREQSSESSGQVICGMEKCCEPRKWSSPNNGGQ